jgi:hypothetical protein
VTPAPVSPTVAPWVLWGAVVLLLAVLVLARLPLGSRELPEEDDDPVWRDAVRRWEEREARKARHAR